MNILLFSSGSWGREWMLKGKRVLYDDEISDDGHVALGRLSEEVSSSFIL